MDSTILPATGTFVMGLFVGYLIRYFVVRISIFHIPALWASSQQFWIAAIPRQRRGPSP